MEIERKYFIESLLDPPANTRIIRLSRPIFTEPVVRIRREDDTFYPTYKSKGRWSGRI